MFQAVVFNGRHPEYGVATIALPIPNEEYDQVMERLEALELGDPLQPDCWVKEVIGPVPVLKRLENSIINVDELDYLAKRLDSFSPQEIATFQAVVSKQASVSVPELINLTFCCQESTVIQDFRDLEAVGRRYLMDFPDEAPANEPDSEQLRRIATRLITSGNGTVTPYGVVYDNAMRLEQVYQGSSFPEYYYEQYGLDLTLSSSKGSSYLHLPMSDKQMERTLLRAGITDGEAISLEFQGSSFPEEVDGTLELTRESLTDLNQMCRAVCLLSEDGTAKLAAAITMAEPETAYQIRQLAENLDAFEFIPKVSDLEEYGKYMIRSSGKFHYDPNLDDVYDYAKYAEKRIRYETGQFNHRGYISYHGSLSMEELMREDPVERQEMEQGQQMG